MRDGSCSEEENFELLIQFEHVLESDPLIDEIGFIHPTQFILLEKDTGGSDIYHNEAKDQMPRSFWNHDHKLGISTEILIPLCKAAKSVFMAAFREYKKHHNMYCKFQNKKISSEASSSLHTIDSEVMKHSQAILLLSPDFFTAWNARKLILLKNNQASIFVDELRLSSLILSNFPKSEQTWNHRRWIIKMIDQSFSTLQEIVSKESELVEKIAERSKMNYRAWNHRCWLVSYMKTEQVIQELYRSKNWASLHVADSSCFHYRRRLMLNILESLNVNGCTVHIEIEARKVWKEELDWNKELIELYVGREGLWFHRRFLSLSWMKHFIGNIPDVPSDTAHSYVLNDEFTIFIDNEITLLEASTKVPDIDFEDFQAQALHAATYMAWLTQAIPELGRMLEGKLGTEKWKGMMNTACHQRPALLHHLLHQTLTTTIF